MKRWKLALLATAAVLALAAGWIAGASYLFVAAAHYTMPTAPILWTWTLWLDALPYRFTSWRITVPLIASAIVSSSPIVFVATLAVVKVAGREKLRPAKANEAPPRPRRALSDVHGHADWMGLAQMQRLAIGGHHAHGGVVLGAACRADLTPSQDGGTAPLIVDRCLEDATHGLLFVGSGGGKTSAFTVPNLDPQRGWRANVLVNDPSSQAGAMCAEMRRDMGQRVVFLGPPGGEQPGQQRVGINVLGWIDAAHPLFEEHVWSAVETLGREAPEQESNNPNGMFKIQGKALQACILADMLADPNTPAAQRTPKAFAERVATPERKMKGLLQTIHEESPSRIARLLAGTLMEAHARTFSGFCIEATADLRWLMTETYADLVSGTAPNSLDPDEFTRGDCCIFLQLGVKTMEDTPQIGRAILNALLNGIYRADGKTNRRYLLLLDEINLFGKLQALATASSQGRKYGVTILGMWHSIKQLEQTWKADGAAIWRANASWEAYSAMDADTAKAVSERCGSYTVLVQSEGTNTSSQRGMSQGNSSRGVNQTTSLQVRKLITPDEAERNLRKDEQVIFKRGENAPIRCLKAYYWRRPDMAAKVGQDQYRIAAE